MMFWGMSVDLKGNIKLGNSRFGLEIKIMERSLGIYRLAREFNVIFCGIVYSGNVAQQYLTQFGNLAKQNNSMIVPADLANVAGILQACTSIIKKA